MTGLSQNGVYNNQSGLFLFHAREWSSFQCSPPMRSPLVLSIVKSSSVSSISSGISFPSFLFKSLCSLFKSMFALQISMFTLQVYLFELQVYLFTFQVYSLLFPLSVSLTYTSSRERLLPRPPILSRCDNVTACRMFCPLRERQQNTVSSEPFQLGAVGNIYLERYIDYRYTPYTLYYIYYYNIYIHIYLSIHILLDRY